jgi:hypothetical protein
MAQHSLRLLPLTGLITAAASACLAIVGSDPERTGADVATAIGSTLLSLWPLYAAPLQLHRSEASFWALGQVCIVMLIVAVAIGFADTLQTALHMSLVLLPLLLSVQLLVGLRINRILLTLLLALAMLTPLWLAPLAALLGSSSGVAAAAAALSPLSALAGSAGCDYLRLMWFYQHSTIGASPVGYPTQVQTLWCCGVILTLLVVASALRGRLDSQHRGIHHSDSFHPRSLQETRP